MFVYKTCLNIYYWLVSIAALFRPKARLFISGRKNWQSKLQHKIKDNNKPVLWMHCASVGEFEQGRVLLEHPSIKQKKYFIVLSFFSPSGYELKKNYIQADIITYLPLDIHQNAQTWINILKPQLALFVKYEIWLSYFTALKDNNIPHYLICAKFRSQQIYFKWYAALFRQALKSMNHIFVQTEEDAKLLQQFQFKNHSVAGDLRYERVLDISKQHFSHQNIEAFLRHSEMVIVAGSTWAKDEELLLKTLKALHLQGLPYQLIIAPHEIHDARIASIINTCEALQLRQCQIDQTSNQNHADVMIVNSIGILSKLYRYGKIAYVGGGFGKGIHNTLEAAVYGVPVLFGPKNEKFAEAQQLKELKCGFEIKNQDDLQTKIIELYQNKDIKTRVSTQLEKLFQQNQSCSELILKSILH
jgi:3-deoxy-D-manno-octulosonic-acid transferase